MLRAAGFASSTTGATIGSHTIRGHVARSQLDILESVEADPNHFVWIHAHQESDIAIHHEFAKRGAWIEYDGIGEPVEDERFIDLILRALDAGLSSRVLLSHDRGWYDPAQPGGGTPKPFNYLSTEFCPS